MKIIVDSAITMAEVRHMASSIGATLRGDGAGGLIIAPDAERHGNGHVVKLPHHHGQFKHCTVPTAPEAA